MAASKKSKQLIKNALSDQQLQTALDRAVSAYKKARAAAMSEFDLEKSRNEVRAIKEHSIDNLDSLFAKFKYEAEKVGVVVHESANGEDAAEIVRKLAEDRGVKLIVKSKSMLTEEIELNPRLQSFGLEVVETDLGEWIIQLAHEKPSHFTAPAMHKTREQVAELFSKVTGDDIDPDIAKMVKIARKELREKFVDAQMGISGANIAIAETGGIVIVANEGNDRLVTTLPPIHVAIVGYEKLVPSMDDALAIIKVLSKSGTGQKQTAYVNFITGPSRTSDIEKTLTLGAHGPGEMHIIFVDNGRKAMAADPKCREGLYCIKCGACLNMCPVYRSIGGHAFGNAYMGGIGAVVTAHHRSLDAAEDTVNLCTGCGYCKSICPSKIDIPDMVLELRKRLVTKNGIPFVGQASFAALRNAKFFRNMLQMARSFQSPLINENGTLKELPFADRFIGKKTMPGLAPKFLKDILPDKTPNAGKITVSLFAGCMLDFIYPEIGESIWKVLEKSNVTALYPKDQTCCGAPAIYTGDLNTARKLAIDNIIAMEAGSPDYIVTGCPTCAVMLKERFPMILEGTQWHEKAVSLSQKVMDFSQFACEVLDISIEKNVSGKATYHDPCHQVRSLCTSGFSRDIIKKSGMEFIEMEEPDQCCGFAGSYAIKQPGISDSILNRKIKSIENTGADYLVTDCPGCIMQIRGGLMKHGSSVKVCHTAQILSKLLD